MADFLYAASFKINQRGHRKIAELSQQIVPTISDNTGRLTDHSYEPRRERVVPTPRRPERSQTDHEHEPRIERQDRVVPMPRRRERPQTAPTPNRGGSLMGSMERQIFDAQNQLRTNPQSYIPML